MKNKIVQTLTVTVLLSIVIAFSIIWIKYTKPTKISDQEMTPAKPTEENPDIFFASNGKSTVYKIKKGNQWSVIWNGVEGKTYDFVSNPVFSFDGNQIAYNAEINGQAFVVVNNTQEIKAYQKANYITFSRDGSTIAFVATKGNNAYSVISAKIDDINGTLNESQDYSQIGIAQDSNGNYSAIIMSNNGKKIAYVIIKDNLTYVIVDGKMSQGYNNIISFSFSDDGLSFTFQAKNGDKIVTVVNNQVVSSNTNNNQNSNKTNPTTQVNNYRVNPSSTYRYKISTDKDIILDQNRLDYSACSEGGQCNF